MAVTALALPPRATFWLAVPLRDAPLVPSVTKLSMNVVVKLRSDPYEVPAELVP